MSRVNSDARLGFERSDHCGGTQQAIHCKQRQFLRLLLVWDFTRPRCLLQLFDVGAPDAGQQFDCQVCSNARVGSSPCPASFGHQTALSFVARCSPLLLLGPLPSIPRSSFLGCSCPACATCPASSMPASELLQGPAAHPLQRFAQAPSRSRTFIRLTVLPTSSCRGAHGVAGFARVAARPTCGQEGTTTPKGGGREGGSKRRKTETAPPTQEEERKASPLQE